MYTLILGALTLSLPFTVSRTTFHTNDMEPTDPTSLLSRLSQLPPQTATFTLLTALLLIYIFTLLYTFFTSPLRHIPGPSHTLLTRLPLKHAIITGRRIFHIDTLHQRYGPLVRISPSEISVADPEAFTQIHRVGSKFTKSIWYQQFTNFPKAGVFTMLDPREHGPRRRLLSRPFSRTHLVEHWERIVKEKVKLCVAKIRRDAEGGGRAEVLNWWMLLASDISAHLAFGESFRMVETEEVRAWSPFTPMLTHPF